MWKPRGEIRRADTDGTGMALTKVIEVMAVHLGNCFKEERIPIGEVCKNSRHSNEPIQIKI